MTQLQIRIAGYPGSGRRAGDRRARSARRPRPRSRRFQAAYGLAADASPAQATYSRAQRLQDNDCTPAALQLRRDGRRLRRQRLRRRDTSAAGEGPLERAARDVEARGDAPLRSAIVRSASRARSWSRSCNAAVGGAAAGRHLYGDAADPSSSYSSLCTLARQRPQPRVPRDPRRRAIRVTTTTPTSTIGPSPALGRAQLRHPHPSEGGLGTSVPRESTRRHPRHGSHLSNVWFKVTDLEVVAGKGCRVTTVDGDEYLDFAAGIAVNRTGHSHPHVVAAIPEQAGRFIHAQVNVFTHDLLEPLAARLAELAPGRDRHVLLRQLRRRDHRGRGEAGQAGHRAAQRHRVQRLVPRAHPPGDGDDHVEDGRTGRATRRCPPASSSRRSPIRSRPDADAEVRPGARRRRPPARDA